MKNIGQMMKQAQQMQAKMAEMQARLETVEMSGSSGGGMVTVSKAPGQPTLEERERAQTRAAHERVASDPLVRAVLETFPGASIERVRERALSAPGVAAEAANEDGGS